MRFRYGHFTHYHAEYEDETVYLRLVSSKSLPHERREYQEHGVIMATTPYPHSVPSMTYSSLCVLCVGLTLCVFCFGFAMVCSRVS
jgi:hypothetical protein